MTGSSKQIQRRQSEIQKGSDPIPLRVEAVDAGDASYVLVTPDRVTSDGTPRGITRLRLPGNVYVAAGDKIYGSPQRSGNGFLFSALIETSGGDRDFPIRLQHDTTDVSNPPTDAELDAIYGTPATVGAGFFDSIDDNAGGANVYLVLSDGANWWTWAGTKAT